MVGHIGYFDESSSINCNRKELDERDALYGEREGKRRGERGGGQTNCVYKCVISLLLRTSLKETLAC